MSLKEKDIAGQVFGYWTAISRHGTAKYGDPLWKFKCVCGVEKIVLKKNVQRGKSRSCGCKFKEHLDQSGRINPNKLPDGEGCINNLFLCYKRGAKIRNLEFNISREDFKLLIKSSCSYCGNPPESIYDRTKYHNGIILYNGIDRLDNSKGYINGNCATSCKICNYAKSNLTHELFFKWIDRLAKFNGYIKGENHGI